MRVWPPRSSIWHGILVALRPDRGARAGPAGVAHHGGRAGAPLVGRIGFDPAVCPLVVARQPQPADTAWSTLTSAVAEHAIGLVFVLEPPPEPAATGTDVIGVLADAAGRRTRQTNVAHALSEAQHPAGRLAPSPPRALSRKRSILRPDTKEVR